MKRYITLLLLIFSISLGVGSVCGYVEHNDYGNIKIFYWHDWESYVPYNGTVNILFINKSSGEPIANANITAKYVSYGWYEKEINTTTNDYGIGSFKLDVSKNIPEVDIRILKINNKPVDICAGRIHFGDYWSIFEEDRVITKNGSINISVPIAKVPYANPYKGNVSVWFFKYNNWKLYKVVNYSTTNGIIYIHESNISNITTIGINGWNLSDIYGSTIGCKALFDVYPNESYIPYQARIIPDSLDVQKGENVPLLLMVTDADGKPIKNKTFTVVVEYDGNWENRSMLNITTNNYGLAIFNITANANDWINVEVYNGTYTEEYPNYDLCSANIHIKHPPSESSKSEPTLELYSDNDELKPNEKTTLHIEFKNGTKPISNVKILLYDNDGYLGKVTTNANGEATYTYKKPKEGLYYILAITNYKGNLYYNDEDLEILNDYNVEISNNENNLIINASNCMYKIMKLGIDYIESITGGFNETNKVIPVEGYGVYVIEGKRINDWPSNYDFTFVTPFKIEKEDIESIPKFSTYNLKVTVKDNNGNPVKNATVIGDIYLWGNNDRAEYYIIAKTDDNGQAILKIRTYNNSWGSISIFVSDGNYLFPCYTGDGWGIEWSDNHIYITSEDHFEVNGTPKTYIDLKGSINYKIVNETENSTTFEITSTITNNGNIPSGEFNTTMYINDKPIKTIRMSLNAGESKEIKINYTTNSTEDINIKVAIDTNNEVSEFDENNNIITETIRFPDVGIDWVYIPTSVKINETKDLCLDLKKAGYGNVDANLTVKFDNKIIYSEKITFNEWYYDWKYREIPITFNETGTHNITITITPIGLKDRNINDNTKTISVSVKEIKADIKDVYGIPYNKVLKADGEYWIDIYYNVSIPDYYTIKINTTKGLKVLGESEKTKYTWRDGWTYFKVKATDISNNENITIGIYYKDKLLANKTITGIKITDNPVEIKYTNITYTNSTVNLIFRVFNTTKYDVDRHIEYMVMVGEQGRVLKGIEYLAKYPHGCIEQTTSPMVASIYVKKYCEQNNISTTIHFDNKVNNGIKRLTKVNTTYPEGVGPIDLGNNTYAWGLWGAEYPSPIHTGYVLYGLTTAKMNGYNVTTKYIENGARYLIHSQNAEGSWNIYVPYYMRDKYSSNALITISLAQTYNITNNETLKQEIFNATNKSVRYLIKQKVDDNIYDLGFKAWALSAVYMAVQVEVQQNPLV